jgi:hypothetical protein
VACQATIDLDRRDEFGRSIGGCVAAVHVATESARDLGVAAGVDDIQDELAWGSKVALDALEVLAEVGGRSQ